MENGGGPRVWILNQGKEFDGKTPTGQCNDFLFLSSVLNLTKIAVHGCY